MFGPTQNTLKENTTTGSRTLLEGVQASPKQFYDSITHLIVNKHAVPDVKITRKLWKEGWIFSKNREYLRVARHDIVFEICGAPFGKSFFVSFRRINYPVGFFKRLIWRITRPDTFYQDDTVAMYELAIETILKTATDELGKTHTVLSPPDPAEAMHALEGAVLKS